MCGIIGYTGFREASPVIIDCLKRLEYRGYDSAGLAVIGDHLSLFKNIGSVDDIVTEMPKMDGRTAIGHTRWATHGAVTRANAHPHTDCHQKIAIVHNGIIENYQSLRQDLKDAGHVFATDTDTEVIAHLLEDAYNGNLLQTVTSVLNKLAGHYALVIISKDEPGIVVAARKESPLVIGLEENEQFVASDVPAFLPYTKRVLFLEDGEIAVMNPRSVQVFDPTGKVVKKE